MAANTICDTIFRIQVELEVSDWLLKISTNEKAVFQANTPNKKDNAKWNSIKDCAQKWCRKLCAFFWGHFGVRKDVYLNWIEKSMQLEKIILAEYLKKLIKPTYGQELKM